METRQLCKKEYDAIIMFYKDCNDCNMTYYETLKKLHDDIINSNDPDARKGDDGDYPVLVKAPVYKILKKQRKTNVKDEN